MSLQIVGKLVNQFKANDSIDPDTKAVRPGKHKIQIMGQSPLESGENRLELIELSVPDKSQFVNFLDKQVVVPVRLSCMNGNIYYSVPAGSSITEVPQKPVFPSNPVK